MSLADVFARRKGFERIGALLGRPVAVDPARPNTLGRATRSNEPPDFPLYRVLKVCRRCRDRYEGLSPVPQYDDQPEQAGYCPTCVDRLEAGAPAWAGKPRTSDLMHSEPAQRASDPLEVG